MVGAWRQFPRLQPIGKVFVEFRQFCPKALQTFDVTELPTILKSRISSSGPIMHFVLAMSVIMSGVALVLGLQFGAPTVLIRTNADVV